MSYFVDCQQSIKMLVAAMRFKQEMAMARTGIGMIASGRRAGTRWWRMMAAVLAAGTAAVSPVVHVSAQSAEQAVVPARTSVAPQYSRILVRNAMLIDGTGSPVRGMVDIHVRDGVIVDIRDSAPIRSSTGALLTHEADAYAVDHVIDAEGRYVMPGLIDTHAHLYPPTPRDFIYKLFLAHGVTSLRNLDGNFGEGTNVPEGIVAEKRRIAAGQVVAPRMWVYPFLPDSIKTASQIPPLVKRWHALGVDGIKLVKVGNQYPDMIRTLGEETRRYGMGLAVHIPQSASPGVNALVAVENGVTTIEHHYGYPEIALPNTTIPFMPLTYNYGDERQRFRETLAIWLQADMEKMKTVVVPQLVKASREGRYTMNPTMVVYEKQRDFTRAANVPWLDLYARPSDLQRWRTPDPTRHGAIFDRWTSNDEASAAQSYRNWMAFLREYVKQGGHASVGSDSGGPFQLYGFQTIRELELFLEAGLTPLEVVRAATQGGARTLQQSNMGVLRPGFVADMVIVDENPLQDFKVLIGRGPVDGVGKPQRRSRIRSVIVDGRVYDPDQLLADVEQIVLAERAMTTP
ncbi:amidohydrolase family protein [Sphingopyxis sp.]|uniref:amidohydrolase family protein n=1 Tax=Sphingopyxis sp. TaxID=1908224 RepID=UPI001DAB1859|nr:amidohydrolase family protein [Sphingopyxis sp.]MBW8296296.1 amidohydrolase family protein [Sphingopyxis sp.]